MDGQADELALPNVAECFKACTGRRTGPHASYRNAGSSTAQPSCVMVCVRVKHGKRDAKVVEV